MARGRRNVMTELRLVEAELKRRPDGVEALFPGTSELAAIRPKDGSKEQVVSDPAPQDAEEDRLIAEELRINEEAMEEAMREADLQKVEAARATQDQRDQDREGRFALAASLYRLTEEQRQIAETLRELAEESRQVTKALGAPIVEQREVTKEIYEFLREWKAGGNDA